ncbi:MAG: hypothetical protein H6719_21775 [Sandaracinaceae bacterium]|nr:hypothetical protein [Sandaracinaceae bacterium]
MRSFSRSTLLVLALLPLWSCQPISGVLFDVHLPEGELPTRELHVDVEATNGQGAAVTPDRTEISMTARGYIVEVAWFETTVDATVSVWVDVDGDGQRGASDLVGALPGPMHLTGQGCEGIEHAAAPIVLRPLPAS